MEEPRKPDPPKWKARAKRLVLSGTLGVLVGLLCRSLPEPWQLPCQLAIKLVSLFVGGS